MVSASNLQMTSLQKWRPSNCAVSRLRFLPVISHQKPLVPASVYTSQRNALYKILIDAKKLMLSSERLQNAVTRIYYTRTNEQDSSEIVSTLVKSARTIRKKCNKYGKFNSCFLPVASAL